MLRIKTTLDAEDSEKIRLVPNLPISAKILEKIIAAQICHHLEQNNLPDKMQSA